MMDTAAFAVGVAAVAIIGLLVLRFLIAVANGHDVQESAGISGKWFVVGVTSVVAAVGMGLVGIGEFGAIFTDLIGSMPTFFGGLVTTLLGWLTLEGHVALNSSQYVGLAALLLGGVILLREVSERGV